MLGASSRSNINLNPEPRVSALNPRASRFEPGVSASNPRASRFYPRVSASNPRAPRFYPRGSASNPRAPRFYPRVSASNPRAPRFEPGVSASNPRGSRFEAHGHTKNLTGSKACAHGSTRKEKTREALCSRGFLPFCGTDRNILWCPGPESNRQAVKRRIFITLRLSKPAMRAPPFVRWTMPSPWRALRRSYGTR